MKILITGSEGVIGRALAYELTQRGHQVLGCDLFHRAGECGFSVKDPVPARTIHYARCDVGELRQVARIFDVFGPFDMVYHAAAEFGRWNGEDFYENLWRTNVVGTKNILRIQEKTGFNLVHFSSSEVYGDWSRTMTEDVPDTHPITQLNDYAMTKWVNEMQVRNSAKQYGTSSVIVRLFNTYGPGEFYTPYRSVNCRFIYCALMGLPIIVHRGHTRTSTFIGDAVRTLANIPENFHPGEAYNIGGDKQHTIERLAQLVLKVTDAPRNLITLEQEEEMTTVHKVGDFRKARADLDHRSTMPLERGLRITAEWMKNLISKNPPALIPR